VSQNVNWSRHPASWVLAAALVVAGWVLFSHQRPEPPAARDDLSAVLRAWDRETTAGAFPRPASERGQLRFPREHGVHTDVPFEVWDIVMRLPLQQGTYWLRMRLLRLAAAPHPPDRASAWAAGEFLRAELTLVAGAPAGSAHVVRNSRVALGIAGRASDPPKLWIDGDHLAWVRTDASGDQWELVLHESELQANLQLTLAPPRVTSADTELTGGPWTGYLHPHLAVTGELKTADGARPVLGTGWFTHNWGPVPPVGGQVTFDRWLLQFDQGDALVLVQTRRRDGSAPPSSRAVWIAADGQIRALDRPVAQVKMGLRRPDAWSLITPDGRTRLKVEATTESTDDTATDQGMAVSVRVEGQHDGRPVTGWGVIDVGSP